MNHCCMMTIMVAVLHAFIPMQSKAAEPEIDPQIEPALGDYTVVFDHYAQIPMQHGQIISDAPSLVRTRDSGLLCAVPYHLKWGKPKEPMRPLVFFRSMDGGTTWSKQDTGSDFCCGTLFRHEDALYFLGAGPIHRDPNSGIQIIRSTDEGYSWTEPVMLFRGSFYNPAGSYVMHNGYFYWCFDTGRDSTFIVAGDLHKDLTDPAAWRISNALPIPQVPPSMTRLRSRRGKILEGNVVEVNGRLQVSWRFMLDNRDTVGVGVICDIEDDGNLINYRFRQFHPLPGAQNQFYIVHDPVSGLYWMSANLPTRSQDQDPEFNARLDANPRYAGPPGKERRILALFCSFDALNWLPAGYIIVWPLVRQASNYCGLLIDGDDLLVVARTSRDGADQHDNDLITFHRVQDFRQRASFLIEGGDSVLQ